MLHSSQRNTGRTRVATAPEPIALPRVRSCPRRRADVLQVSRNTEREPVDMLGSSRPEQPIRRTAHRTRSAIEDVGVFLTATFPDASYQGDACRCDAMRIPAAA